MTDPSVYAKTLALPAGFDAPRLLRYDDVPGASSGNRLGRAAPEVQMLKRGRSADPGRATLASTDAGGHPVTAGGFGVRSRQPQGDQRVGSIDDVVRPTHRTAAVGVP
jgi:hypothetical protein